MRLFPPGKRLRDGLRVETAMGSRTVVVLQPAGEDRGAFRRGVVGPDVRPLPQGGLDETLRFPVGARGVGSRAAVPDVQRPAGRAEAAGDVPRSIVSQYPSDPDAMGPEPLQRPTEKAGHRLAPFVGQQFDIGDPGMIIDRDMQTLPADAVMEIDVAGAAGDAGAHARDPTEFLRIDV